MGGLEVELLGEVGSDPRAASQLRKVQYLSPFMGSTALEFSSKEDDYGNAQKSYGMWMVPPDVGTTVMVVFVQGDPKRGFWIGCVQDNFINFMTPGYAATTFTNDENVEGDKKGRLGRIPVAEYNKIAQDQIGDDTTLIKKSRHPFTDILEKQGLLLDDIRGITSSSARREWPSAVFGISTPGPIDKQSGAPKGKLGKKETETTAFVSRLGGSSFVMDDGDDKFLRKTKASDGPPEYASIEEGEDGEVAIPHNELIRLRTRTGHQILLHNSEDLIYIGNARGTSWIELSSDGKIDIYAEDSISVHTKQDFNFYADRDMNIEVGRNFNLKVAERHQTEIGKDKILMVTENTFTKIDGNYDATVAGNNTIKVEGDWNLNIDGVCQTSSEGEMTMKTAGDCKITPGGSHHVNAGGSNNLTAGGSTNILSGGSHIESASAIHMNGPGAGSAAKASDAEVAKIPEPLKTFANPDEKEAPTKSIMLRIPSHEPWPHHENLDPASFKPDKTDRESGSDIPVPESWKSYSTAIDTFAKSKKD
jgi:hypothetical protein